MTFVFHRTSARGLVVRRHLRHLALGSAFVLFSGCAPDSMGTIGASQKISVAEQLILNGQEQQGFQILNLMSSDFSGSPTAQNDIASAYLRLGAFRRAEQAFRKVSDLGRPLEGTLGLGRVALAQNNTSLARDRFAVVLAAEPAHVDALNGYGVAYDIDGRHDLARQKYAAALSIDPAHVNTLNNMALSNILSGNGEYAVTILSELARTEAPDQTIADNLALGYFVTGRKSQAFAASSAHMTELEAVGGAILRYRTSQ